jgi:hypothetical protein
MEPAEGGLRLSNSKVKTWRRCPKMYEFKYVMGLKKKEPAVHLRRGSWLHELLMVHYDGHDWLERHAELTRTFLNETFEEEREEYGDLPEECERIMRSYVQHWKQDDAKLRTVDTEVDELIALPNGDVFNFIIDWIVEDNSRGLWLYDTKTVGKFMSEAFMTLDTQLARYFWAAERMGYRPLRGVVFNEVITRAPTKPEVLKNGRLTERKNLQCDVYTYYHCIQELGQDPREYAETLRRLKAQSDRWFRRTPLPRDAPLTKMHMKEMMMSSREIKSAVRRGEFPRTVDKSCEWGCDYMEPCMIQLHGGDISEVIKRRYEQRTRGRD